MVRFSEEFRGTKAEWFHENRATCCRIKKTPEEYPDLRLSLTHDHIYMS